MSEADAANASQQRERADPLRLALVGCGAIARQQHLPVLQAHPNFALVAVVDPSPFACGCPWFSDLDALLASGLAIDAVSLATPPQLRAGIARKALDARIAVLLEKPPASSVAEAEALLAAAHQAGVTVFAAWHSQFAPLLPLVRDWLAGHELVGGRMSWREDVRRWHPGQDWIWQPGGMGVFDPGINGLSILTALYRQPLRVAQARFEVPANAHTPIAAKLELQGAKLRLPVDLDFRVEGAETWRIELLREDGAQAVLDCGGARWTLGNGPAQQAEAREYQGVYDRFAALVRAGHSEMDLAPLALVAEAFAAASVVRLNDNHP